MLTYQRHLLKARIGTILGSTLLCSWTLAWCLLIWNAGTDQNPLAESLIAITERYDDY